MFKRWFGGSKKRDELSSQPKHNHRDLRVAAGTNFQPPVDLGHGAQFRNQQKMQLQQQLNNIDNFQNQKKASTIQLPKRFAQSVIELEIQCERPDATKEHVKKLMDLYTAAIEYYNCNSDFDNQMFFQNKMHTMLNRNDIKTLVDIKEQNEKVQQAMISLDSQRATASTSSGVNSDRQQRPNTQGAQPQMSAQALKQLREKQIAKKKFEDALQLKIYNHEKKHEVKQEQMIEKQLEKEEEVKKVVQREQHQQSEAFRKRLAERARSKNNRSVSVSGMMLNQSLSFNFNAIKNKIRDNGQYIEGSGFDQGGNNDFETNSNNLGGFDSSRKFGQSKIGMLSKMNSQVYNFGSATVGTGGFGSGNQISGAESNYSFGRSQGNVGGGLASKISMALSRVVYNRNNSLNDDDDVADLISLIEELNQHTDLTVKLNNQSKICKILETNDDFFTKQQQSSNQDSTTGPSMELNEAQQQRIQELTIKDMMDKCKQELQQLQEQKEKAIEEFLEKNAEEKFSATQEIKMKYQKMINMLKNSKDPKKDEKIQGYEDKKKQEIETTHEQFKQMKIEGLKEIKDQFNEKCAQVKIDAKAVTEAVRNQIKRDKQGFLGGGSESPIKSNSNNQMQLDDEEDGGLNFKVALNEYGLQDNIRHRESTGYIGKQQKRAPNF